MKIGILSFAHTHALSYAEFLRDRDDIDLLTTDPDRASRPAEESGGADLARDLGVAYTESLDSLLAWEPDAIIVCSENSRHRAEVEKIAAAGVHILCEKPLATTPEDARAMVQACDTAGVFLMTAFPVRFTSEFTQLQHVIRSGQLGSILSFSGTNNGRVPTSRAWFTDPGFAGGGSLTDHTVHVADLIFAALPDAQVESVYAEANRILHPDLPVETAGLVLIRYTNGLSAVVDCSWSKPEHYPVWGGLTLRAITETNIVDLNPFASRVDGFSERERSPLWLSYGQDTNATMIEEFLSAVTEGRQPVPNGRDGLRTVEIVSAAYESLTTRKPVTLSPSASSHPDEAHP